MNSPYSLALGGDWEDLAPGVQLAHSVPVAASGNLKITHSSRFLLRLVSRLILLPPAGESVLTRLTITEENGGVKWVREFGTMKAVSIQKLTSDGFIEEAGPFRLVMRIILDGDSVRHQQIGLQLFGLRVPGIFGPSVVGWITPGSSDHSWHLKIEIGHALLGMMCRYEGEMTAE